MPESNSYQVKYSVSLIGSLKSHLKGLLGYETMILELMQNADDAKAKEMVFDIRDKSLRVTNSAEFKYCGDLNKECTIDNKCDFHRIFEFASGLKENNSENIGKFGIGFASTYQITDCPKIISHGISAEFHPEIGSIDIEEIQTNRTTFDLPWAKDNESKLRIALGLGNINDENINKLYSDCEEVLNESLLFLRHLSRVELKRNGQSSLIVSLNRKRSEGNHELSISFEPKKRSSEQWIIFENECSSEKISQLKNDYPLLVKDNKNTEIQIAVKTDSIPIRRGLIYAYLPTKQPSFMPLHINADFYPDPSRKSINLSGGQHQQKWNELLIEGAAEIIAIELETMTKHISHKDLFELLLTSYKAHNNKDFPFTSFWSCIENSIKDGAKVFYNSKGLYEALDNMAYDKNLNQRKDDELSIFYRAGGKLLHEDYLNHRSHHFSINFLEEIGINKLSIKKFSSIIYKSDLLDPYKNEVSNPSEQEINEIFVPLWSYADAIIALEAIEVSDVGSIEFALTITGSMTRIDNLQTAPNQLKNSELANILKLDGYSADFMLANLANDKLFKFKSLYEYIKPFNLYSLVVYLENFNEIDKLFAQILIKSTEEAKVLYELIADLDLLYTHENNDDINLLLDLKNLPIWKTSKSFDNLQQLLLPGNFDDPLGDSRMLDSNCLSPKIEKFIEKKLEVNRQTIKAYIDTILPTFFVDGAWTEDNKTFSALMLTFANYENLLEDEETLELLKGTPLIPNKNGDWETPSTHIYFYNKKLEELIGDETNYWVDEEVFLKDKTIKKFFKNLGVSSKPSPFILLDRIITLAKENPPLAEIVQKSANLFYALCELYINSSDKDEFIDQLRECKVDESCDCFPILNDNENWHSEDIYEPYDYKSFESSDVNILAFTTLEKIIGCEELMQFFTFKKVEIDPVIEHLQNCIEINKPLDELVYKVLNDLGATSYDLPSNKNWIYYPIEKKYIRPNQTFLKIAPISGYTYMLPDKYLSIDGSFFKDIGVMDEPNIETYIDIILKDLVGHYVYSKKEENLFEQAKVSKNDIFTYIKCVNFISENYTNSEFQDNLIELLLDEPSILSHQGKFNHCDDILIDDSKWYRDFFESENNRIDWLTDLTNIDWLAFEEIGLKKLSKCVKLKLVGVNGESKAEIHLIQIIRDRESLFLRAIPDQSSKIKRKLVRIIKKIKINSYEKLIVEAHVNNNANVQFSSDSKPVKAFFKEIENELLISLPIEKNNFIPLFKPILNDLLEETDVKATLAVFDAICSKSLVDGSTYLNELGYNNNDKLTLDEEEIQDDVDTNDQDLEEQEYESDEIKNIDTEEEENQVDVDTNDQDLEEQEYQSDEIKNIDTEEEELIEVSDNVLPEFDSETNTKDINVKTGHIEKLGKRKNPRDGINNDDYSGKPGKKTDGKSNKSAQQKLTSYIYTENKSHENNDNNGNNEINLEIEVKSRAIVVEHEKKLGRVVKEMSQDNPGYDLISSDKETGEVLRYIEVKGTTNKWGKTGVSVSYTQFSHAQDKGDKAWLYVVDDIDGDSPTLYRIQDFAIKTKSFMFDSGWTNILEEDDKFLNYVPGVLIDHEDFGKGEILSIDQSSSILKLKIKYESGSTSTKPLNITTMKIIKGDS